MVRIQPIAAVRPRDAPAQSPAVRRAAFKTAAADHPVPERPQQCTDPLHGRALLTGTRRAQFVEGSPKFRECGTAVHEFGRGDLGTVKGLVERDQQGADRISIDVGPLPQLGTGGERIG